MKTARRLLALIFATAALTVPSISIPLVHAQTAGGCLSASNLSVLPPAGFAPLQASDSELRCYGFPARPTDSLDLAGWEHAMSHYKTSVIAQLAPVPGVHFGLTGYNNANWAGYTALGSENGGKVWNGATVDFHSVSGERNQDNRPIGSWVGLGGTGCYDPLTQAGILLIDNGQYNGQGTINFFTEYVGNCYCGSNCAPQKVTNISVSHTNEVYIQLSYDAQDRVADIYFENVTTGVSTEFGFAQNTTYSGDTVEWVQEDAYGQPYTSYNSMEFDYPDAWSAYVSYAANSLSYRLDQMGVYSGGYFVWYLTASPFQSDCCGRFYTISLH